MNIVNNANCKPAVPQNSGDTLISNYPNPFISKTTISFKTNGGHTLIQIINNLGQVIKTLVDQDYQAAGMYTTSFDAYGLSDGVYYARLQNGSVQQVRTMLKVR